MQDDQLEAPYAAAAPRRSGRRLLVAVLLLIVVMLALAIAAWRLPAVQQQIDSLLGSPDAGSSPRLVQASPSPQPQSAPQPGQQAAPPASGTGQLPMPLPPIVSGALDTRLALLEDRLGRLDLQAQAASGNATRAEGLLIAFAARRTIDRGAPLGYLEDQLKLRFADAQPNAVQTVIDAAHTPVTLDRLYAELDALSPKLTGSPRGEDTWAKVKREVSNLFIVRHESDVVTRPEDRVQRAKLMLASGKITEAIAEVELLPGASGAQEWIASARRYDQLQRALDLLETTAMLDPRRLKDDRGATVEQPSPLNEPAAGSTSIPAI